MTALIPLADPQSRALAAALTGLSSNTQRVYAAHIRQFYAFLASGLPITRETVQRWLTGLQNAGNTASSLNQALAAVKRLVHEAAEAGWMDHTAALQIESINAQKIRGVRQGNWLTAEQVAQLLAKPDRTTRQGRRDAAVLALLIGCGLRRSEAAKLKANSIRMSPEGKPFIADIEGKGNRVRSVRIPAWAYSDIYAWHSDLPPVDGYYLRSFRRGNIINGSLSDSAIRDIVLLYTHQIGLRNIAPHDLRRSHAALAKAGGAPMDVIQRSLGHASITTTEIYLRSIESGNAGDFIRL